MFCITCLLKVHTDVLNNLLVLLVHTDVLNNLLVGE